MAEYDSRLLRSAIRILKQSFDDVRKSELTQEELMTISWEDCATRTAKGRGRFHGMLESFFEVPEVQMFFKEA